MAFVQPPPAKRLYSEAIFWYRKAHVCIDEEVQAGGFDEDEGDRQRKLLSRELKYLERELVPNARKPPGEGSKGGKIKGLNLKGLEFETEPCAEFASCAAARAALVATCGKWLTPPSGARGGGDGKKQSLHAQDAELSAACKIKLINIGTENEKAVIYWLKDAEKGAPDAFQARISAHLAAFLRINAHFYRICSPTPLCAPRHAFFRI